MGNKYFVINTYDNIAYGLSNDDIANFKEIYDDFFAFYDKNENLMFILPKRDIKSITVRSE